MEIFVFLHKNSTFLFLIYFMCISKSQEAVYDLPKCMVT